MRWHDPLYIRELIVKLTETPSITRTYQECEMANQIINLLKSDQYFIENPEFLIRSPIPGDRLSREVIAALVKGRKESKKTVVLLSHYDVVDVDDYGRFRQFAFQPDTFTARLRSENIEGLNEDTRNDLASGQWLFGRGIMDMKAGLAIQIAVLLYFAQSNDFNGNLLLLTTPDEETNSEGMLEAISLLNRLKEDHDLDYELCICSEANWSAFPGDNSKYIYTGSIGKLLPVVFCVGMEAHVGEPLLGVNAAWMIAELVNRIELSIEFMDEMDGETSPPPTCLDLHVLKDSYNVQTPRFSYGLFNVLTLKQSPQDVLDKLKHIAYQTADDIFSRLVERHRKTNGELNVVQKLENMHPKVFTYSELYKRGVDKFGEDFVLDINDVMSKLVAAQSDPREATIRIAQHISCYFVEEAPFYVLMFAPPYYPHVYLNDTKRDRRIKFITEKVLKDALEEDNNVKIKRFYPGLSDVSYCRIYDADNNIDILSQNMPVWNHLYSIPLSNISKLDIPTINIGPYGKDAHKWTERLELSYSTEVAPQLLANAIRYVLGN